MSQCSSRGVEPSYSYQAITVTERYRYFTEARSFRSFPSDRIYSKARGYFTGKIFTITSPRKQDRFTRYLGSLSPSSLSRRKPATCSKMFSARWKSSRQLSIGGGTGSPGSATTTHFAKSQFSPLRNRRESERQREREREREQSLLHCSPSTEKEAEKGFDPGHSANFLSLPDSFSSRSLRLFFLSFFFRFSFPLHRASGFQLSFPMETRTADPDHSTVPKHLKTFNRKQRWRIQPSSSAMGAGRRICSRGNMSGIYDPLRANLGDFEISGMNLADGALGSPSPSPPLSRELLKEFDSQIRTSELPCGDWLLYFSSAIASCRHQLHLWESNVSKKV